MQQVTVSSKLPVTCSHHRCHQNMSLCHEWVDSVKNWWALYIRCSLHVMWWCVPGLYFHKPGLQGPCLMDFLWFHIRIHIKVTTKIYLSECCMPSSLYTPLTLYTVLVKTRLRTTHVHLTKLHKHYALAKPLQRWFTYFECYMCTINSSRLGHEHNVMYNTCKNKVANHTCTPHKASQELCACKTSATLVHVLWVLYVHE